MNSEQLQSYMGMTLEQLEAQETKALLTTLKYSRGAGYTCSCGPAHHCGDDVLPADEQFYNKQLRDLQNNLRKVLAGREHIPTNAQKKAAKLALAGKPRQKKQMKY